LSKPAMAESFSFTGFATDRLPQPYAGPPPVLVDELYACGFKSSSHDIHGGAPRLSTILLQLVDSHDSNTSSVGKSLLAPPQ
jgi:hypothetical protein